MRLYRATRSSMFLIWICIYIYIYICLYIYIYIYIYMYVNINIYIRTHDVVPRDALFDVIYIYIYIHLDLYSRTWSCTARLAPQCFWSGAGCRLRRGLSCAGCSIYIYLHINTSRSIFAHMTLYRATRSSMFLIWGRLQAAARSFMRRLFYLYTYTYIYI